MLTIEQLLADGARFYQAGQLTEAEACFEQAVRLAPENADARGRLGVVLFDRHEFERARVTFEAALAIDPNNARSHSDLANVLVQLNLEDEAEAHYRDAIRLDPQLAIAYGNLGALLDAQRRFREALDCLTTATRLDSTYAQAFRNLGSALLGTDRFDEAIAAGRRAIELNPNSSHAHGNLGSCYRSLGRLDQAIESYRTAVRLNPHDVAQHSNLLYALNFVAQYDPPSVFAEHRQWGRKHADALAAASAPHVNDRTPGRRLRLGYVSGHFYAHAVNFFSEPILASHDHAQFEVFCYSNVPREDDTTKRLRTMADHWREIHRTSDEATAEMVRRDQIDILIDLGGHIGGSRLLIFARKPAPVQVTYIGYQNTTGMAAMDYRLTDAWSDPPGTNDESHTEKLVRLPVSFFCYQPSADAPPVSPLPALANAHVTFGSFNSFAKVTPEVLSAWGRLLKRVPGSRLVILANAAASLRKYLARSFEAHGIGEERVVLADRRPRALYLELLGQVDIALDPFPFNGHTTTCDALWQGVPVVTLAGRTYASRFGSSAHNNLGLEHLVANSPEEYIKIAAELADDLDRLAALRAGMRERMAGSPLLDFAGFTRNLEAAYRKMWTDWCASAPY